MPPSDIGHHSVLHVSASPLHTPRRPYFHLHDQTAATAPQAPCRLGCSPTGAKASMFSERRLGRAGLSMPLPPAEASDRRRFCSAVPGMASGSSSLSSGGMPASSRSLHTCMHVPGWPQLAGADGRSVMLCAAAQHLRALSSLEDGSLTALWQQSSTQRRSQHAFMASFEPGGELKSQPTMFRAVSCLKPNTWQSSRITTAQAGTVSMCASHIQVLWMQADLKAAKQVHLLTWQPWVGLPPPFCTSYCHLQPPVFSLERVPTSKHGHEHGSHASYFICTSPDAEAS